MLLVVAVMALAAMAPPQTVPGGGGAVPAGQDSLAAVLLRLEAGQTALGARLDSLDRRLGEAARATGADTASVSDTTVARGERAGQVIGEARDLGLDVVLSVLVVALFMMLIRALTWVLDTLSERSAKRRLFYKRLVPILRIVLWVFAVYLIVAVIFQVSAQGVFAAAAAVGVAVGFAAQDLLKNLFGGIILVFDRPFQVGDKISVGGTYGEVVSIGLRSTRIVTSDDNLVSVPNAQVVDGQVANANAGQLNCQVVTELYLPGFIDESVAKKIAFDAAASSKYVFLNKPIVVLVKDTFKETFLTQIKVKAYVLDPRYEFLFQSDVTERARAGFRDAGLADARHGVRAFVELREDES
jgi:small-conductance mechanosensitive channel